MYIWRHFLTMTMNVHCSFLVLAALALRIASQRIIFFSNIELIWLLSIIDFGKLNLIKSGKTFARITSIVSRWFGKLSYHRFASINYQTRAYLFHVFRTINGKYDPFFFNFYIQSIGIQWCLIFFGTHFFILLECINRVTFGCIVFVVVTILTPMVGLVLLGMSYIKSSHDWCRHL
jgi:hypothetical protein